MSVAPAATVAAALSVMMLPLMAVMYEFAAMPVPVTRRPTARPAVLATVMLVEAVEMAVVVSEAGAATLAKSRAKVPPLSVRAPVKRLSLEELIVKTPAPSLVSARLAAVAALKTPENVVLVSSRPNVSVVAVPPELVTVPAPAREPTVWPRLLMSSVAPAAMVTALRCGITLPIPAWSLPALIAVLPV